MRKVITWKPGSAEAGWPPWADLVCQSGTQTVYEDFPSNPSDLLVENWNAPPQTLLSVGSK